MKEPVIKLTSTMEDYLEVIYSLSKENGFSRVGEIAQSLNVKSPSVNSAVKFLSEKGLVTHQKYGYIGLTKEGERMAAQVQDKHDILFRFLTEFLMLDKSLAQKEACGIEHAISQKTFLRLTKFFKFLGERFNGEKPKFLENFEVYLKTGEVFKCKRKKSNGEN